MNQFHMDMADFVGIPLTFDETSIKGSGDVLTNWGLCKPSIPQKVMASRIDTKTKTYTMLVGSVGNLGFIVEVYVDLKVAQFLIIDRSLIEGRGCGLFNNKAINIALDELLPADCIKARFEGSLRGPWAEVNDVLE